MVTMMRKNFPLRRKVKEPNETKHLERHDINMTKLRLWDMMFINNLQCVFHNSKSILINYDFRFNVINTHMCRPFIETYKSLTVLQLENLKKNLYVY